MSNIFRPKCFDFVNVIFIDKRSMWPWPKCEHIEALSEFSFQTRFLQFVWISNNKIHSKNNIFHTLVLKIVKLTLLNFTHPRLSNNPQIPI